VTAPPVAALLATTDIFIFARPQAVAIHGGVPKPWLATLRSQ